MWLIIVWLCEKRWNNALKATERWERWTNAARRRVKRVRDD
jgi:hypothetical protein